MTKILVIDNYDSFAYNLVHIVRELGYDMHVCRNDKTDLKMVAKYDKILLSPGPGIPIEAGIMMDIIKTYAPTKSIMGVCLGHQGISESFGAKLFNMPEVFHGVAHKVIVTQTSEPLFNKLPSHFMGCRYHSWTVIPESVPRNMEVTAIDEKGNIMGLTHKKYDVRGLQFHPESVLTEHGKKIIENWLNI